MAHQGGDDIIQERAPTPIQLTRRHVMLGSAAVALGPLNRPHVARAAQTTKIRFLTSWFARAEHGGFYQALATGRYAKAGLDVSIDMGGPQVNGLQLLTGGNADVVIPISCEQGVCGTCVTRVRESIVDHRDLFLTEAEKATNEGMTVCCSRAMPGNVLVLEV